MKTLYTGIDCPDAGWIHAPMISVLPPADPGALEEAARSLRPDDTLLFTSRFAARHWADAMERAGASLSGQRVVSIGPRTSEALRLRGIPVSGEAEPNDSFGVVALFERLVAGGERPGRVVFPRSDIALPLIPDGLRALGYEVVALTAYRNAMPADAKRVPLDGVGRIVFTSPSTVDNFVRLHGGLPDGIEFVARGAVTRARLEEKLRERKGTEK